jgi:hypothetical protein
MADEATLQALRCLPDDYLGGNTYIDDPQECEICGADGATDYLCDECRAEGRDG